MTARKLADEEEIAPEPLKPVERLCSEIQLFDLCDLEKCSFKNGKFCTNADLLEKFEQISEEDETRVRVPRDLESDDEEDADLDDLYDDEMDEQEE